MIYIIYLLIVLLGVQDFMNRKERRKLVEAIMAKDLPEFKKPVEKRQKVKEVPMPDTPVEHATDEQFDRAIRADLGKETIADKVKRRLSGGKR